MAFRLAQHPGNSRSAQPIGCACATASWSRKSVAAGDRRAARDRDARVPQLFPPHRRAAAGHNGIVMPDINRVYLVTGAASAIGTPPDEFRRAMDESALTFTRPVDAALSLPRRSALEALVRLTAVELAKDGITVNAVAPGLIVKDKPSESRLSPEQIAATEALIPMRHRGRPDEVAEIIAFLASPKAVAIEMALLDIVGKSSGLSVADLLGGRVRDTIPLSLSIADLDFAADLVEA
uniref:SDR family oxidoreductase n=1 Tax=Bradyrhizobium sp. ISRA442 TaxID=2866197 RepID=UPI00311ACFC1